MPTIPNAKYVHTNLIARDWQALSDFYTRVFGCTLVPPERDLSGRWLDEATGVPRAHIRGAHLRLPGHGDTGPTLEIFQYDDEPEKSVTLIHRPGLGHLAFHVDDVDAARDAVLAAGGSQVGTITDVLVINIGRLRFVYVTDPEGNVIELQKWYK